MKVDSFLARRLVLRPIPNFYIIVSLADALFALAGVPIFYGAFCLDLFFSVLLPQAVASIATDFLSALAKMAFQPSSLLSPVW